MKTGDVIKELRLREGLTQQELAERLGVATSSVKKYEGNSVKNLKLSTIQELCKIFRVMPLVFVFPDAWRGSKTQYGLGPEYYKYTAIYFLLTDEGKHKILSYVEDIASIDRYLRKDVEDYEKLITQFMQIATMENE